MKHSIAGFIQEDKKPRMISGVASDRLTARNARRLEKKKLKKGKKK